MPRNFWAEIRPSSTEDDSESGNSSPLESEAGTVSSVQVGENFIIETLEDEVQNLQKSNIEWKSKYKAAKTELKRSSSVKLESENRMLERRVEKIRSDSQRRQTDFDKLKSDYDAFQK